MLREEARTAAFTLVYQVPFHADFSPEVCFGFYLQGLGSPISERNKDYIKSRIYGVFENLPKIDTLIEENLRGWEMDRLNSVDLAVIRLAIYEILFDDDIQNEVCINEAVNLAKKYGDEMSQKFVNGVLASVVKGDAL
ncbi:N utilization substance protein B [Clostridia bacterium]|nr:N utilization substance protein B [Clostridia bacterium]GHU75299.1 N utilization substance protein B [Clostridia bacterium]